MEESIVYTIQSEFTEIKETVVHIEVMRLLLLVLQKIKESCGCIQSINKLYY